MIDIMSSDKSFHVGEILVQSPDSSIICTRSIQSYSSSTCSFCSNFMKDLSTNYQHCQELNQFRASKLIMIYRCFVITSLLPASPKYTGRPSARPIATLSLNKLYIHKKFISCLAAKDKTIISRRFACSYYLLTSSATNGISRSERS